MKNNSKKLRMLKSQVQGITLIALVVTVIVLLILAGVAINLTVGDNGLFKRAQNAAETYDEASEYELRKLTILEANTHLEEYEYEDVSGQKIKIPAKCAVSQVEGENTLADGLVIIDANGNEWVWIEVPQTLEVYATSGLNIKTFTDNEYATIEKDLHSYAIEYRFKDMTTYRDEYYSDEITGLSAIEYNELKHKMLKSIYQNGGFWIGRYEAGTAEYRNEHTEILDNTNIIPLSQKNSYPFLYVTCSEAQTLSEKICEELNLKNYTSSLMFGIQWDLVLKYLETKGISKTYLNVDSSSWGNYSNSSFTLNDGKYTLFFDKSLSNWYSYVEDLKNYVLNSIKQKITLKDVGVITTTGSSDRNCKMNIYDFAGNVYEWTLEFSTNISNPCVRRGGASIVLGNEWPANAVGHSASNFAEVIGFRITIY